MVQVFLGVTGICRKKHGARVGQVDQDRLVPRRVARCEVYDDGAVSENIISVVLPSFQYDPVHFLVKIFPDIGSFHIGVRDIGVMEFIPLHQVFSIRELPYAPSMVQVEVGQDHQVNILWSASHILNRIDAPLLLGHHRVVD